VSARETKFLGQAPTAIESSFAIVSCESSSAAAYRFSRRCLTEDVPGISRIFGAAMKQPCERYLENLLVEAKRVGVKRIVKLSGKISDHETAGFSQWNRDAERRIKQSGIPYTILRGKYFMQNLFGNAKQNKKRRFHQRPSRQAHRSHRHAGRRSRGCRRAHRRGAFGKDL